jgi:hypothetical protein
MRFNGSLGEQKVVDLDADDVDTFQAFFTFLYSGKL